jgi:hypothetical protein
MANEFVQRGGFSCQPMVLILCVLTWNRCCRGARAVFGNVAIDRDGGAGGKLLVEVLQVTFYGVGGVVGDAAARRSL